MLMETKRKFTGRYGIAALAVTAAMCLASVSAMAQPGGFGGGGRGPMMDPAKLADVWTAQAKGVAKELALSDENTGKLVDLYKTHREALMKSLMGEGDRQPGRDRGAMREATEKQREEMKTELATFLPDDQVTKIMSTLGSFSWQWDGMVNALQGLGLDEATVDKAMPIISAYVADSAAARAKAMESDDREAMRAAMTAGRDKLDKDLAEAIGAEAAEKFKAATSFGGGRGGRGPGGDRGDRGDAPAENG